MVSPSETDPVRVEGDDSPDLPEKVLSADGTEWVDATPENVAAAPTIEEAAELQKAAAETVAADPPDTPAEVEARERTDALVKLLEQNSKTVAKAIRAAQPGDEDVLAEIMALEKAGKDRKTVIDIAKAKMASLKEEAKPKPKPKPKAKTKKAKKPRAPKREIKGKVKEILGSFWKDEKGNTLVLDNKMGEPSGVYVLRLIDRARS